MITMADTSTARHAADRDARSTRLGALAGLGFTVSLFLGVAMLDVPQHASNAALVRWWSDSGHQRTAVISMYLFAVAGLLFVCFLRGLRTQLLEAEGGAGAGTSLVDAAGTVFTALLLVAGALRGVIAIAALSPVNGERLPGPDTLRYLPELGYAITGSGTMLAAALCMAATSWLVVTTAALPRWVGWVGIAAALLAVGLATALAAVLAFPALFVWVLAVSFALWRAGRS